MNKTRLGDLKKSVRQAGQVLRGVIEPMREFQIKIARGSAAKRQGFALCVKSAEPTLLIPAKVYRARFASNNYVGVTDEAGEAAVYPSDCFIRLDFPSEVETVLVELQKAA